MQRKPKESHSPARCLYLLVKLGLYSHGSGYVVKGSGSLYCRVPHRFSLGTYGNLVLPTYIPSLSLDNSFPRSTNFNLDPSNSVLNTDVGTQFAWLDTSISLFFLIPTTLNTRDSDSWIKSKISRVLSTNTRILRRL